MKKFLLITLSVLILSACAEKNEYEQAVLEQMKKEKDIKDYKITPELLAKCVAETSADNMPGIISFDPKRLTALRNYTKMLSLSSSKDPKKSLEELRKDFGSPQELAEARTNYTESIMQCYSVVISKSEDAEKEKD